MSKKDYKPKKDLFNAVILKPLQVSSEECNGDTTRLIKKFQKKVRNEETLKPYFGKLMYFTTKSQKRRAKRLKAIYEQRKNKQNEQED